MSQTIPSFVRRHVQRVSSAVACVTLAALPLACAMGTENPPDGGSEPEVDTVEINFAAKVGTADFACGQTFPGIGTQNSTIDPIDFRLYVHNVQLINSEGEAVNVTLTNDGKWQTDRVTLLDFEDATGSCSNGNADINGKVVGTVPAGTYDGLRFSVGVPFEDNHADVTLAPSPLNLPSLFWNWNGGYKFARIDNGTTGLPNGFNIHIGSTGCDGDMEGNVTTCTAENRGDIALSTFDPATDVVDIDLAELLADVDVDTNTDATAPGCMSTPDDPECATILGKFGIGGGAGDAFRLR